MWVFFSVRQLLIDVTQLREGKMSFFCGSLFQVKRQLDLGVAGGRARARLHRVILIQEIKFHE